LPFTYNAMRGLLLPSGFRWVTCSGYSTSVLFLGNISVPQKTTEIFPHLEAAKVHFISTYFWYNLLTSDYQASTFSL
jgi:hypothetical protein